MSSDGNARAFFTDVRKRVEEENKDVIAAAKETQTKGQVKKLIKKLVQDWIRKEKAKEGNGEQRRTKKAKRRGQKCYKETSKRLEELFKEEPQIVVDMEFAGQLPLSARNSLYMQLSWLFSHNRNVPRPCKLVFAGLAADVDKEFRKKSPVDKWETFDFFECTEKNFQDFLPKENIVYLSADSETEITSFDSTKTYVIGGIVDRNSQKGVTASKAAQLGVATAKLPLDAYNAIREIRKGSRKVITVNQVGQIILDHLSSNSWDFAFDRNLPSRLNEEVKRSLNSKDVTIKKPPSWKSSADRQPFVAVVFGGSKGIGFAVAKKFRLRGWSVVLVARTRSSLFKAAQELREMKCERISNSSVLEPVVIPIQEDCSKKHGVIRVESILQCYFTAVKCIVCSSGQFCWDDDPLLKDDPRYLWRQNFESRDLSALLLSSLKLDSRKEIVYWFNKGSTDHFHVDIREAESPSPCDPQKAYFVCIGSDAGQPDFAERVTGTENETKYIEAMQKVRHWSMNMQEKLASLASDFELVLLQPPLLDTEMARREFKRLDGIDWSTVPSTDNYISENLNISI
mmetsp:Transcript_15633/g.27264  ORF Transcript_15633/g.27264 Transcript_15633/m.27264 type:complete len:570 (-) Transcript_15633:9-1718(-)